MSTNLRIEKTGNSTTPIIIEIWERSISDGVPDAMITELALTSLSAITGPDVFLTKTRYRVVREG